MLRDIAGRCCVYRMTMTWLCLFESRQCLFDSSHCLTYVVVACGVAHAEALWVAESVASYSGNMTFFEQIHCEVGRVAYSVLSVALSEEATAFREDVECTFWLVYFKSGYVFSQLHDEVAASLESLSHSLHAVLWQGVCCLCRFLTYRARSACVLSLSLIHI